MNSKTFESRIQRGWSRERALATPVRARGAFAHGTRSAYCQGCRCEPCRTANREYSRGYAGLTITGPKKEYSTRALEQRRRAKGWTSGMSEDAWFEQVWRTQGHEQEQEQYYDRTTSWGMGTSLNGVVGTVAGWKRRAGVRPVEVEDHPKRIVFEGDEAA